MTDQANKDQQHFHLAAHDVPGHSTTYANDGSAEFVFGDIAAVTTDDLPEHPDMAWA